MDQIMENREADQQHQLYLRRIKSLKELQKIDDRIYEKRQLLEIEPRELEEKEVTATAGGGAVEVTVSGRKEITKVKLSEEVVDPDDIEMLEDLIAAAVNEAFRQTLEEL